MEGHHSEAGVDFLQGLLVAEDSEEEDEAQVMHPLPVYNPERVTLGLLFELVFLSWF